MRSTKRTAEVVMCMSFYSYSTKSTAEVVTCMSFYSYSTKSTAEVVRMADDEGVWCFAITQLRALRVTCRWP